MSLRSNKKCAMQQGSMSRLIASALAILILATSFTTLHAAEPPFGRWLAEDIRGSRVMARLKSVLEIRPDGVVAGTGGCNRLLGRAKIVDETIIFYPVNSTRMACVPAVMDQELKFHSALRSARRFAVQLEQHTLVLYDVDGNILMRLLRL